MNGTVNDNLVIPVFFLLLALLLFLIVDDNRAFDWKL